MRFCRARLVGLLALALAVGPVSAQTEAETPKAFFLPKSATAAAYMLGRLSNADLIAAPRSEFVYVALLQRKGLDRKYRVEALEGLAKARNTDALTELLTGLTELDKKGEASTNTLRELAPLLGQTKPEELKGKREALLKLAADAQLPLTRQLAYAAIVTADDGLDALWTASEGNAAQREDVIRSVEWVRLPALRGGYYAKVEPLVRQAEPTELRQAAIAALPLIPGHETEAFRTLAGFVLSDTEKAASLASLQRFPKNFWLKETAKPLLDQLVADLQKAPAGERTEPAYVDAVQFAQGLASLLPPAEAAAVGKTLRGLGSSVFVLHTIPEQMLYDQNQLVVEAGKAVEIILQNDDNMPHNLVITAPGKAEEVGNAAEKMSLTPDAQGRTYVPALPSVLHATVMVEGGQRAKIAFTAPEEPGDYPYLCSFPGHWRRMLGNLAVVKDVEAFMATNSVKAPTITEWKLEDFTAALAEKDAPRNLAHGRELFTKLACASCHQLGSEGAHYGPDLSTIFAQYHNDRAAVLRQILEPSLVISNRYRNETFTFKDGEDATGIIMKEDDAAITIQTGPAESLIQKIAKADIAKRQPKELSPMPAGLLSTLSKEEVLDLLAWLETGGKPAPHGHQH